MASPEQAGRTRGVPRLAVLPLRPQRAGETGEIFQPQRVGENVAQKEWRNYENYENVEM
jgi:hypothetical protein